MQVLETEKLAQPSWTYVFLTLVQSRWGKDTALERATFLMTTGQDYHLASACLEYESSAVLQLKPY